ncbi:YceD family protein [Microcoleus sp. FACHB-1515]|uniref:YceD family protein n=1 Tax=Microcoleus sp. FACHB-1515 TaxID=2692821 RepID=UPI0037C93CB8
MQGEVRVTHRGNYLEVEGHAEAIATLTCDRCLKQYNHRIKVDTTELIWLQEPDPEVDLDREVPFDEFVETLPPNGYFHPIEWLYEQLCLEIPQRKICAADCNGIETNPGEAAANVDRRWSSLEILRQQLSN